DLRGAGPLGRDSLPQPRHLSARRCHRRAVAQARRGASARRIPGSRESRSPERRQASRHDRPLPLPARIALRKSMTNGPHFSGTAAAVIAVGFFAIVALADVVTPLDVNPAGLQVVAPWVA